MRIYISSSWKNRATVRQLADLLVKNGHAVFDFTNDAARRSPGISPESVTDRFDPSCIDYRTYLDRPEWMAAVTENRIEIAECDLLILLLPAGTDASCDWALAVGLGKRTAIIGHPPSGEYSPSHLWMDSYFPTLDAFATALHANPRMDKMVTSGDGDVIAFSGPTGAGKSTLSRHVARIGRWKIIPEPDPFAFDSTAKHAEQSDCSEIQRSFLLTRFVHLAHVNRINTIADRWFTDDREVFLRLHLESGHLTRSSYQKLEILSQELEKSSPRLRAVVFLNATRKTLFTRISNRAPMFIIQSLDRQIELYRTFRKRIAVPCLDIDTSDASETTINIDIVTAFVSNQFDRSS